MAVEAEDAAQQLGAKAVHHRHDDDERRHAERDAGQRENGDDGDEALLPPRAQIAEGDHPLESTEDHGLPRRWLRAASGDSSCFAPVLRFFISTMPFSKPRGPITICHGRPIKSMPENLAPGDSSRSS